MTSEAQPGQEQRMEIPEDWKVGCPIANAAWEAIMGDDRLKRARSRLSLHEIRLMIGHASRRPTADLGDDGELVEGLRRTTRGPVGPGFGRSWPVNPDGPEAADRLILYREALDRAGSAMDAAIKAHSAAIAMVPDEEEGLAAQVFCHHLNAGYIRLIEASEQVSAVLSRSGG